MINTSDCFLHEAVQEVIKKDQNLKYVYLKAKTDIQGGCHLFYIWDRTAATERKVCVALSWYQ